VSIRRYAAVLSSRTHRGRVEVAVEDLRAGLVEVSGDGG
jgi:hypothetical protein